jgi:hypothetical protein
MTSSSVPAGTEASAQLGCEHTKDNNVLYQYTPIENTEGAIRLLILRGGTGRDIDCDLIDSTIDNRDRPYEAVSYTWGPDFASDLIKIRGKDLPVTFILGLILRDLRSPDVDRVIWVDAVCINQQDAIEKGYQVAQMKDIFRSAKCVLFCICRPTEQTDFLMDSLKRFQDSLQDTKSDKRHDTSDSWREIQNLIARQHLSPHQPQSAASLQRQVKALTLLHRQGLEYMLNQPWFLRVWILQEVANASSALVYCGRKSISAITFALMPELLEASIPREQDQLVSHVLSLMPGPLRAHVSQELYPLLQRFRDSLATVEHDKIYALFGICQDKHIDKHLTPNYVKSEQDVIRDTIAYICQVEASAITNSRFDSMSNFLNGLDWLDDNLLSDFLYAGDHRNAVSHIRHRGEYIYVTSKILTLASTDLMMKEGVMALLLELRGADVLFSYLSGWHATCVAAENGHDALANSMLGRVTDIDAIMSDADGPEEKVEDMENVRADRFRPGTRLFLASRAGNINSVRLLLDKGADINKKAFNGYSPFVIAGHYGHWDVMHLLEKNRAYTGDIYPEF